MTGFADAHGYDLLMGRWSKLLAREFVGFAGITDGARVLDAGCGTGSLADAILAATRPAEVVGVDPSPTFVELAQDRFRDARARFETGDAQNLAFRDGYFTCTAAMLVLNFVPNRARAAAEMQRVTRGGGLVAACVWDYGGEMTMLRRFWDAAVAVDPSAAPRHEGGMPLCRAGELGELWRTTGLEHVREGHIVIEMPFSSFDDFWKPFLSGVGPSGSYAASLSSKMQQALEARLRADLWKDRPEEARTLPARAWAVVGTVPLPKRAASVPAS
jgi:SAM-dependent methyltransferase